MWCGWDFCVRSNRKNRDSAAGRVGIQAKVVAYDEPERRFIQARSSGRPRLSPLATKNRDSAAEGGKSRKTDVGAWHRHARHR